MHFLTKTFVSFIQISLTFVSKLKGTVDLKLALAQVMAWGRANGKPFPLPLGRNGLTHWGRVAHICVSKVANIGSDNGLPPGRRQTIIWTNVGILLSGPLATNFSEILIDIYIFSLKKMYMEM